MKRDEINSIITLADDFGNDVNFKLLDRIEYDRGEYVVLLPVEDENKDESSEIRILGVDLDLNDDLSESYYSVKYEDVLQPVFEIFKNKFKDEDSFAYVCPAGTYRNTRKVGKMNIALSEYRNEKEEAVALIRNQFLSSHLYPGGCSCSERFAASILSDLIEEGLHFYFITVDFIKVGYVILYEGESSKIWLDDIFIVPAYRNEEIGSNAMELVEELVKEKSWAGLTISANVYDKETLDFYHKLGYDRIDRINIIKNYHVDDDDDLDSDKDNPSYAEEVYISGLKFIIEE